MQRFSPKACLVVEKKILKSFYHIWAWRQPWSMDLDQFSNLSSPWSEEAQYKIWAKLAQRLQKRSRLKSVNGWMDNRTDGPAPGVTCFCSTDGKKALKNHLVWTWKAQAFEILVCQFIKTIFNAKFLFRQINSRMKRPKVSQTIPATIPICFSL